jgi:hypothetical protein
MNSFVFIGQFVSKNDSLKDNRVSQAGNNYQLKFIELLNPQIVIALFPIFYNIDVVNKKSYSSNIIIVASSFFNGKINYLFRFILDTIKSIYIVKKSKIKNIFFYNLDKQNSVIIFISKFLLKCNIYIIVADFSTYENKSIFDKYCNWILHKINGAIVFNSNIKVNHNQLLSLGLINEKEIIFPQKHDLNKNVIMSGSLGITTGFEIVLDTFKKKPDWNLYITGKLYKYTENEFSNLMQDCCQYKNIHYMGLLSYEQYLSVLDKCDIAISLRNPNDIEHQYNFPSKILEYFSKSKIVVSSLIYKDLPLDFLFYSEFNSISLSNILDKINCLTREEVYELKFNIYTYLRMHFTQSSLLSICNDLMEIP